jgi:carbon monoxide dehydrogenase subunit G
MEFHNDFDVQVSLDQVWATVLDVERVAPCVPGAEVLERTGEDSYKVGIRVRVGPVSMQYRGDVEIVEKDPSSHSAVMTARAKETRGQGTANANVRMTLSGNGDSTHGSIATEVQLSGKAAAMGHGVIRDVSARLVDQFAENLAAMLGGAGEAAAAPAAAGAEVGRQRSEAAPAAAGAEVGGRRSEAEAAAAAPAPGTPSPAAAEPTPPTPPPPREESLELLPIVRSVAAERLRDPRVLVGAVALVGAIGLLLARRRR